MVLTIVLGRGGLRALSRDSEGGNLPRVQGPRVSAVQVRVTDPAVFRSLEPKGYAFLRAADEGSPTPEPQRPTRRVH